MDGKLLLILTLMVVLGAFGTVIFGWLSAKFLLFISLVGITWWCFDKLKVLWR